MAGMLTRPGVSRPRPRPEIIRWSKKFSDRFSRFDTIPAVTDTQPPSQAASHVAVAITLNAKASSLTTEVAAAVASMDATALAEGSEWPE